MSLRAFGGLLKVRQLGRLGSLCRQTNRAASWTLGAPQFVQKPKGELAT